MERGLTHYPYSDRLKPQRLDQSELLYQAATEFRQILKENHIVYTECIRVTAQSNNAEETNLARQAATRYLSLIIDLTAQLSDIALYLRKHFDRSDSDSPFEEVKILVVEAASQEASIILKTLTSHEKTNMV
jgi:hypothetical protein